MAITLGAVLRGKYAVSASIGRGGMGEVFAARRLSDGLDVALKVVSRAVVDDTSMARLEREAVAAGRIKSEFVPEVYEIDRTEEGELFLVMRRLWGESMSQRLRERGVIPWHELRPLVDDVLSGLIDAHAAGVVHRDLKPANIFLERIEAPTLPSGAAESMGEAVPVRERARVLDFGVCKLDASDLQKLTTTGETVGTVSYMAPEQIRGSSVDARADLYALATVVFEAVCARMPFEATLQMALLAEKLESAPRRLRELARVAVPSGLDALVARALSRKAVDRFESAEQMRAAWRALGPLTAGEMALPITAVGVSAGAGLPTETGITAGVARPVSSSSRVGLAIAGLAVLIGVGTLALAMRPRAEPSAGIVTPAPSPPPSLAPTSTSHAVSLSVVEIGDSLDAGRPTRPLNVPKRPLGKPAASASQGPHITTIPRY